MLLVACSADGGPDRSSAFSSARPAASAPSTPPSASAAAPKPEPLSAARILEVGRTVHVGDRWDATERRVVGELGPSTRRLMGLGHVWMVPGKDECTYFVMKYSGEVVSEVTPAATHPRSDRREFEDCFWYVDETPPDKDPKGPGPEPGRVYSVKEALAGLEATRSKWVASPIRVRGVAVSVVRTGPSDGDWTNATVGLLDEHDSTVRMAAQVDKNVRDVPHDGQKVVVTVEGRIDGHAGWVDHAKVVK